MQRKGAKKVSVGLMNSDIYEELELTHDITFDKDLKAEVDAQAARRIQRWYREVINKRMMEEADRLVKQTNDLVKMKKERLRRQYMEGVADSLAFEDHTIGKLLAGEVSDWEKRVHVDRKENFSLFSQVASSTAQVLSPKFPSKEHHRVVSFAEEPAREDDEENKLKALNDLLKANTFPMLRKEDEDEFEQFVTRLRPKTEDVDVTHLTGTIEEASPTKPQQQFQLRIKDPSALEYIEDEVQSIMSSAVKEQQSVSRLAPTR